VTFTESLPQLPPRCKITRRLLEQAGCEVRDRGITPAEAARHAGISWPSAHQAFAAAADPVLDEPLAPVTHLGIDEHRRGRPRWMRDPGTGEYDLLADRWHTCFTVWVPITSSTSCDQAIFVERAADGSVSSDAVLVEIDRLG
jgi:transposase